MLPPLRHDDRADNHTNSMTHLIPVEDLGPQFSFHDGRLYHVIDVAAHPLLPRNKPRQQWVFEAEIAPGGWELIDCHFPKWKHPHSGRTKFLSAWLGGELRPEMLDNPKVLVGRTARLEIRTSVDSDGIMTRVVVAARPNPNPVNAPGTSR